MTSESCAICGKETDADVLDEHGHFSSDDEERCWICLDVEDDHDDSDHDHKFELAG